MATDPNSNGSTLSDKTLYVHTTAPHFSSIVIGAVAGTFIVYIWGMLAWMAFGLHDDSIHALPDELAISDALRMQELSTGVYVYPAMANMQKFKTKPSKEEMKALTAQFEKRHKEGPIFSVIYHGKGEKPMGGNMMFGGFVIQLLASCLAAILLALTAGTAVHYWQRVLVVVLLAVFGLLISHIALWNWMYYPASYTFAMVLDPLIGWTLAGLAMAYIIKPRILREGTEPVR